MTAQAALWTGAGAAAAVALIALLADRRRARRRELDRPGLVPWPLIQILATFIAVVAAAFARRA